MNLLPSDDGEDYDPGMTAAPEEETSSAAELAAPTEQAGIAEADTRSTYAWGEAEDIVDYPTQRLTPKGITTAAVAASVVVIAAASAVAIAYLNVEEAQPVAAPPSATVQAPPPPMVVAPPAPPPLPVLTGVDGKFITTLKGYGVPVNDHDPQFSVDLAKAVCATTCIHTRRVRTPSPNSLTA